MLNKRCSLLLIELIGADEYETILTLSEKFKVSNRTIRYDLDKIDDFLKSSNLPKLIRKTNEGIFYKCTEDEKNKILSLLYEKEPSRYVLSQDERIVMILIELLRNRGYITMDKLAECFMVSRSTILKDIEKVREWLRKNNLGLDSSKHHGVKIVGDEKDVRKAVVALLTDNMDVHKVLELVKVPEGSKEKFNIERYNREFFKDIDMSYIEKCVNIAEKQLEVKFTDEAFSALMMHIAIAIRRIRDSKDIVMGMDELKALEATKEFAVASSMAKFIENKFEIIIPDDEIGYITIHLLGSNVAKAREDNKDWRIVEYITSNLIAQVEKNLNTNLFGDKELVDGLIQHIRPTIYRLRHRITLKNPMLEEIKKAYPNVFAAVKNSAESLEKSGGGTLSDEEIGYLTLHFSAAMERSKGEKVCDINAAVVCATGIGTAKLVSSKLKSIFNVNIVDTVSFHDIGNVIENEDIDFIITTVPIASYTNGIPCVEVSPFLTERNISDITSEIRRCSTTKNKEEIKRKLISINDVMDIVKESCVVMDEDKLRRQLEDYFEKDRNFKRGIYEPMLKDVLTRDFIKLNVDAENWEEAIKCGGQILYDNGAIKEPYINEMIDTVRNIGPYIVIAPGIAMPHARPDENVKKIGMSLITLNKPINFGNKDNDPVTIVVCLCAIDHSSHLKALSDLVTFLGDEEFISLVKRTSDPDEIVNYINK